MSLYSTEPFTNHVKIATNSRYMERWLHPQHDAHVKLFREYERVGGYAAYRADFERRHGRPYRNSTD